MRNRLAMMRPSLDRAWQPTVAAYDIPGRLRRSATLAVIVSQSADRYFGHQAADSGRYNPDTGAGDISSRYLAPCIGFSVHGPAVPVPAVQRFCSGDQAAVLPAEAFTLTRGAGGQSNTVIDYIPYPEQIYLEIYHLLFSAEDGTGGAGEDPADS